MSGPSMFGDPAEVAWPPPHTRGLYDTHYVYYILLSYTETNNII